LSSKQYQNGQRLPLKPKNWNVKKLKNKKSFEEFDVKMLTANRMELDPPAVCAVQPISRILDALRKINDSSKSRSFSSNRELSEGKFSIKGSTDSKKNSITFLAPYKSVGHFREATLGRSKEIPKRSIDPNHPIPSLLEERENKKFSSFLEHGMRKNFNNCSGLEKSISKDK
jgi:hypothetical protein